MPALDGKVALVGGGEHVAAIASALLDAGATVIVQSQGGIAPIAGATVVDDPVRDFAAADALVAQVIAEHGRLDIVLTPAPPATSGGLLALGEDPWRQFANEHLTRSVALARAGAQHLVAAGGGRIVTFASSTTFLSEGVEQAAVNAGILSLTSALSITLTDKAVNANCVVLGSPGRDQGGIPGITSENAGLLGATVAHLCSDAAADMHGRYVYCGGSQVGLYNMPFIVAGSNVLIDIVDAGANAPVGEYLTPLLNIGRD